MMLSERVVEFKNISIMPKIAILIATYNGSRFIREQLNSLIEQSYNDFEIYIRDDGSIDGTVDIINEYVNCHDNIFLIKDNYQHLGAGKSFRQLLRAVDAEYYFFCDQDDVWNVDKIKMSYDILKQYDDNAIVAVHTDLRVVDTTLDLIHPSFFKMTKRNPQLGGRLSYECAFHTITGCTAAFNKQTRDLMIKHIDTDCLHDELLGLIVACYGGVLKYIPFQSVSYRQHSNNILGAKPRNIFNKLLNIKSKIYAANRWYDTINSIKHIPRCWFWCNKIYYTTLRAFSII